MNCERFRAYWSEWHDGRLDHEAADMAAHRDGCAACARYDRQMRRLLEELAALPVPAGTGSPTARPAQAPRWHAAPRWVALAATLALGIALGVLIGGPGQQGATLTAAPVVLEGPGEQRIAIAVESPRAYERVEFVVELPPGIELIGFPGQRSVRWEGRLAEGRSRLRLPLRIGDDVSDGELVTRIVHRGGERRLVVPLETGAGVGALDTRSARAPWYELVEVET